MLFWSVFLKSHKERLLTTKNGPKNFFYCIFKHTDQNIFYENFDARSTVRAPKFRICTSKIIPDLWLLDLLKKNVTLYPSTHGGGGDYCTCFFNSFLCKK